MKVVILASRSPARSQLLRQAGVAFETAASDVDEDLLKAGRLQEGSTPSEIATVLAVAKAVGVSKVRPGLVIGADQTLELDGRLFDKPKNRAEAQDHLAALRGRRHKLHAAVALAEDGVVIWSELQSASLTMRTFSDAYLQAYIQRNSGAILGCVGAYQLEGEGVQLFERIDGEYFTILGLPMLGLLAQLRRLGVVEP